LIKLLKYTPPSQYDIWPLGSFWEDGDDLYVQVSDNPETAKWIRMGEFLEASFDHLIHDDTFMLECMNLYKHTGDKPATKTFREITK
jgi:hypothetical protein